MVGGVIAQVWGECIYKGSEPWDGFYRGEPVPNGIYAYKIGVALLFGSDLRNSFFYGDVLPSFLNIILHLILELIYH